MNSWTRRLLLRPRRSGRSSCICRRLGAACAFDPGCVLKFLGSICDIRVEGPTAINSAVVDNSQAAVSRTLRFSHSLKFFLRKLMQSEKFASERARLCASFRQPCRKSSQILSRKSCIRVASQGAADVKRCFLLQRR